MSGSVNVSLIPAGLEPLRDEFGVVITDESGAPLFTDGAGTIAAGTPVVGSPGVGPHRLTATGVLAGPPVAARMSISTALPGGVGVHVALAPAGEWVSITDESGRPITDETGDPLDSDIVASIAGSPAVLSRPPVGPTDMEAVGISTMAPQLGLPGVGPFRVTARGISAGAPSLPNPGVGPHRLEAAPVVAGPIFVTPISLTLTYSFAGEYVALRYVSSGYAVSGDYAEADYTTPDYVFLPAQHYALGVVPVVVRPPVVGTSGVGPHRLSAIGVAAGAPFPAVPGLGAQRVLEVVPLVGAAPVFQRPTAIQNVSYGVRGITTAAPVVPILPLTEITPQARLSIRTGSPRLGEPVVWQNFNLLSADTRGRRIVTAEIETYTPGDTVLETSAKRAWGTQAWGVRPGVLGSLEATRVIRASNIGYRTRVNDTPPLEPYPPLLDEGFAVDRNVPLAPDQAAAAASFGALKVLNGDRVMDQYLASNSDARPVVVRMGRKGWDERRGYETDPPHHVLAQVFSGVATPWVFAEGSLSIPIRDATYWIERPYQDNLYAGTGGLEGPEELKGRPKPRTRGGTTAAPVQNVTPVLVDSVNRIYQYSDGPGTVVRLYEGGDAQITYSGDTTNLYSGSAPSGSYRTDNSRGLFQLGTKPFRAITCDVTGRFPSAGARTAAMDIVRYMLVEDMQLPPDFLDLTTMAALAAAYPAVTGWYWGGQDAPEGVAALSPFFRAISAKMIARRDGRLSVMMMRAPVGPPVARLTRADITAIRPVPLSAPMDPPAAVWRAGWGRNHTIQTTDLDPDVSDARKQVLEKEWQSGVWTGNDVARAYRRPSTPDVVPTALLTATDGTALAGVFGALWGVRRRCYDLEVQTETAFARDVGETIMVEYGMDDLDAGRLALVVGDSIRASQSTARIRVLV